MPTSPTGAAASSTTVMHATTVGEAMHPGIVACLPAARLQEVAQAMAGNRVHCVGVVGAPASRPGAALCGVISDLDLLRWAAGPDSHRPARQIAHATWTIAADARLQQAAELMAECGVQHLVVLDPVHRLPLGILSALDIASVLAHNRAVP